MQVIPELFVLCHSPPMLNNPPIPCSFCALDRPLGGGSGGLGGAGGGGFLFGKSLDTDIDLYLFRVRLPLYGCYVLFYLFFF